MSSLKDHRERVIDCPKCFVKMFQVDIDVIGPDITIDHCPDCDGVWLDSGELRKMIGDRKLADYLAKDIGTKSESGLLCPRCGGLMDLEKAEDIEVDVCLKCNGVWLDAGEVKALRDLADSDYELDMEAKEDELNEEMSARDRKASRTRLGRLLGSLRG